MSTLGALRGPVSPQKHPCALRRDLVLTPSFDPVQFSHITPVSERRTVWFCEGKTITSYKLQHCLSYQRQGPIPEFPC